MFGKVTRREFVGNALKLGALANMGNLSLGRVFANTDPERALAGLGKVS